MELELFGGTISALITNKSIQFMPQKDRSKITQKSLRRAPISPFSALNFVNRLSQSREIINRFLLTDLVNPIICPYRRTSQLYYFLQNQTNFVRILVNCTCNLTLSCPAVTSNSPPKSDSIAFTRNL